MATNWQKLFDKAIRWLERKGYIAPEPPPVIPDNDDTPTDPNVPPVDPPAPPVTPSPTGDQLDTRDAVMLGTHKGQPFSTLPITRRLISANVRENRMVELTFETLGWPKGGPIDGVSFRMYIFWRRADGRVTGGHFEWGDTDRLTYTKSLSNLYTGYLDDQRPQDGAEVWFALSNTWTDPRQRTNVVRSVTGWGGKMIAPPVSPPPVTPPASGFPKAVTFREVHRTRDRGWNISFHGPNVVGEYDNESRHDSRLVKLGSMTDYVRGDWETLQANADRYCAAEKGSKGAPVRGEQDGWFLGRKPRHKISLTTGVLNGKSVTFSADQNSSAKSDYEDSATGALLGTLQLSGAVVASVPYASGLLCALQGGDRATCVTTTGVEIPLSAWALHRTAEGRIFAGSNDGHVRELVAGVWTVLTLMPLGGRVMSVWVDQHGLWAATSKGDLWLVLMDGQARRYIIGKVDYGSGWFGPDVNDGRISRKIPDGSGWRCVIEQIEVVP